MQPPVRASPLKQAAVKAGVGRKLHQAALPVFLAILLLLLNLRREPPADLGAVRLPAQGTVGRAVTAAGSQFEGYDEFSAGVVQLKQEPCKNAPAAQPGVHCNRSESSIASNSGSGSGSSGTVGGSSSDTVSSTGDGTASAHVGSSSSSGGSTSGSGGGSAAGLPANTGSSYALEAEARAWHPPRYSTHTCIGQKFYDNWHAATCKFDNMCLNASSGQWEYYVDPELPDVPLMYNQEGVAMAEFSPHMVNTGHAHSNISEEMGWRPTVVRRPFPQPGAGVNWAPAPQALLHSIPVELTTNFGHVMFDLLVPLFNMQHLFGVYTPDAQPLILSAVNGRREQLDAQLPRLINTRKPDHSLLRLTWDHDDKWVDDYARSVLGVRPGAPAVDGLVCFKTVLAGTGFLNRQMAPVDALPYRQAVARHIGLHEPPQTRPVITILNKQGRRMIENSAEVQAYLQARYPLVEVNMFDFGAHPDMTMPEQVKLMSDTSILVTPCGGLATVLAFMRPGATAIAMNYWHTIHNRSMQLEDNYYQHIEYLDFQYFPVTPDDYAGTSDRPKCENVEGGGRPQDAHFPLIGALVHCNLRLGEGALLRLGYIVDQAVRRWAARTGRYEFLAQQAQQAEQPAQPEQQQQLLAELAQQQQQPLPIEPAQQQLQQAITHPAKQQGGSGTSVGSLGRRGGASGAAEQA